MGAICWMLFTLTLSASLIPGAHSLSEIQALNAFKKSLIDPNNVLSTWDPSRPNPCHWFYITCNWENKVSAVILMNKNLSGNLVPELGLLSALERLVLPQNKLTGTIPPELGNLKRLIYLKLSSNQISGSIPPSLGNLKSLNSLDLDNNKLTGKVPSQIATIPALRFADLSNNNLCWNFWPTPVFQGSYPLCQKEVEGPTLAAAKFMSF